MNRLVITAALAATMLGSAPAYAAEDGKLQVKLLATGVLPDGKITSVDDPGGILTAVDQTKLNDRVVPTLAVEYYMTDAISVETICCLTPHHVSGSAGAIDGAEIVDHVLVLPATVTLKYHFGEGGIRPYVGAGPAWFFYIDEKPGTLPAALGVDKVKLDNKLGVAVQAGIDIPVNQNGMGISFDAKRYWVKTTANYFIAGTKVLETRHKVDPWVLSGGVYFRF
jgi:outer membrane protein